MGRKKVPIAILNDVGKRKLSFKRRQVSLYKKAVELAIICNCEIALFVFSEEEKLTIYSSGAIDCIFDRIMAFEGPFYSVVQTPNMDPNDKDRQLTISVREKTAGVVSNANLFVNGKDVFMKEAESFQEKTAFTFEELEAPLRDFSRETLGKPGRKRKSREESEYDEESADYEEPVLPVKKKKIQSEEEEDDDEDEEFSDVDTD